MVNPHTALKVVSEQACMGDTWLRRFFITAHSA
jgi:hypothetical protein